MRVVHIIKHCSYGNGSVHVAVDLACVQADTGYSVTFVSGGGTFEPLLLQHKIHVLTLDHEQNHPLSMLRTTWKLARFARSTRPHVLHAHMMSSALVGYLASKLSGVPLVTTVHNSFDSHSFLMRLGRKVVAVSHAERRLLLGKGYGERQVIAIPNAPNNSPRDAFMSSGDVPSIDSPCIATVCGLHRRKGVFDLIAACAEVFPYFPQWKLYIVGEGPDRLSLEQQAQQSGLARQIVFLGFVACPHELLKKVDIFVLASHTEPFGLSLAEARGAGCAIVATETGGIPEVLEFGRAGRLVPPADPTHLAAAISSLMGDKVELLRMRKSALQGSEVFNVTRLVDDYKKVYLDAAAR